jgi:predicted Fe-Mo cluster-binding NifX family protein
MKVAIPMFNSRVSPRFDFAPKVLLATVDGGEILEREQYSLVHLNPIRRSSLLCELGVDVLICGGIGIFSQRLILDKGIDLIPMVQGEVDQVLNLFINGNLDSSIIPTMQGKGFRHHTQGQGRCKGKERVSYHDKCTKKGGTRHARKK